MHDIIIKYMFNNYILRNKSLKATLYYINYIINLFLIYIW